MGYMIEFILILPFIRSCCNFQSTGTLWHRCGHRGTLSEQSYLQTVFSSKGFPVLPD